MKNVVRCLFVAVSLVFTFMLGCMYASLDKLYTNINFDENVVYFENKETTKFIEESTTLEDSSDLVLKLDTILTQMNVETRIDVDERKVITSSTGIFKSSEGSVEYTILRVHFTYLNSSKVEDDGFLYFYYSKVNFDEYSLIDISTQDYVTAK